MVLVIIGTSMINSGGWQAQTDYQKMRNIMPTPGRVPVFDLKTHKLSIMDFVMVGLLID